MSLPIFEPDKKYSYSDYLTWNDDERWELIDGIPYGMTPAPSTQHQRVFGRLHAKFFNYLEGKTCEIFGAPFDVRLSENEKEEEINNVVQPDLAVICDKNKIDDKGCKGAPDLIIEILSPGTTKRDKLLKYNLYQKYGVGEYWVVDPLNENVEVFKLKDGRYNYNERQIFDSKDEDDKIQVGIFEDLVIDLKTIF